MWKAILNRTFHSNLTKPFIFNSVSAGKPEKHMSSKKCNMFDEACQARKKEGIRLLPLIYLFYKEFYNPVNCPNWTGEKIYTANIIC